MHHIMMSQQRTPAVMGGKYFRVDHCHEINIWNKTELLGGPVFIPPLYLSGPVGALLSQPWWK